MIYVGMDWSMSSPGVCVITTTDNGEIDWDRTRMFGLVHTKKGHIEAPHVSLMRYDDVVFHNDYVRRFNDLARWGLECALTFGIPDVVAIEDYAYTKNGRVFHIGENGGILKIRLIEAGLDPIVVGPKVVKQVGTGSGNATKNAMYDAFAERFPFIDICGEMNYTKSSVTNPLEDIIDAFWIARWASLHAISTHSET